MSAPTPRIPSEPMTIGELEDYLVYDLGIERSKIVVNVEALQDGKLVLHVPFEQH